MSSGRVRPKTYDIFVGSLPSSATEADVREIFLPFGEIDSVEIRPNVKLNDGTYLAFVRFLNEDDANVAAMERKNHDFRGSKLYIQRTKKPGFVAGGRYENRNTKLSGGGWGGGSGDADQSTVGMFQKPDLDQNMRINTWQPVNNIPVCASIQQNKTPTKPTYTREHVFITHVETPSIFWGQVMNSTRAQGLAQLSSDLTNICQCVQSISGKPDMNKVYGAKFSADDQWYRCKSVRSVSDNSTTVRYIDYGNSETVKDNQIMELPAHIASIKPYADCYILRFIEAIERDESNEKYQQAVAEFSRLTDGHLLDTEIHGIDSNGLKIADIFFDGVSLNHDLLKSGLFVKKQVKNLRGPRNVQSPPQQQQQRLAGGPVPLMSIPIAPSHRPNIINQQQNEQLALIKQQTETLKQSKAKIDDLTREVSKKSNELQKAYGERDNAVLETATTKGRIKILQDKLKEISEQNINEKCKILAAGVASVRMIRRQFPTDDQTTDVINMAIDLVTDVEKKISSDTEHVRSVKEALKNYETVQNQIQTCSDLAAVDELISERDERRVSFYAALNEFLDVTEMMPLQERGNDLKDAISAIKTTYSYYLSYTTRSNISLDDVIGKFRAWRTQKLEQFLTVRTITNTHHNIVDNIIKTIQQDFSLNLIAPDSTSSKVELDQYLNKFQESLRQELHVSNLGNESIIVSEVLQSLLHELESEVIHIKHLRAMREEFLHLKSSIVRWLNEKPDVTPLQSARKSLKSLRSKLGHLLVDKYDLEECDEGNGDELDQILIQLEAVRCDLHKTFKLEDKYLEELADISINHFPELLVKHPELGISTYVQYNGLLKQSLDIDQFNRIPVQDKDHVWMSFFNDEPVFIKEYLIAESVGVSKEFFLQQAMNYNSIQGDNVTKITAVFFYKERNGWEVCLLQTLALNDNESTLSAQKSRPNKQQAYVLSPLCTNLSSRIEKKNLSGEKIHHILCSVLKGLETFHNNGLVYGALHPDNVLLGSDGSVYLADYDLTKSPAQRAMNCKAGNTGLLYNSPEGVSQQMELTLATDIFSFGILMLELLISPEEINVRADGRPNRIQYDSGPCQIVHHLLSVNHITRPVISQLLTHSYFANPYEPPPEVTPDDEIQLGSDSTYVNDKADSDSTNEEEQIIVNELSLQEPEDFTASSKESVESDEEVETNDAEVDIAAESVNNQEVTSGENVENDVEDEDIEGDVSIPVEGDENNDGLETINSDPSDAEQIDSAARSSREIVSSPPDIVSSPPDIVPVNDIKSHEESSCVLEEPSALNDEVDDEMPTLESDDGGLEYKGSDDIEELTYNHIEDQCSDEAIASGRNGMNDISKVKQTISTDDNPEMDDSNEP